MAETKTDRNRALEIAVKLAASAGGCSGDDIVENAKKFAAFIAGGEPENEGAK